MKLAFVVLSLLFAVATIPAFAQKPTQPETYGIFQTRDEYHQFMGSVKQAAANDPEIQSMIGLINDIVLEQPIGSTSKRYGSEAGNLGLLVDPAVRGDIEMLDDQYKELQELNSEVQKRLAQQLRDLDFSDSKNIVSQIRGLREQAERDLDGVLLPHQLQRLGQIRSRSQLRSRSLADLLTSEPLKTELAISDEQSDELRETEKQIEEELARDIANLREAARKELISRLNRSQRDRVEEIFGDTFDLGPSKNTRDPRKSKN